ncbi:glutathione S-transferase family protein [Halosegnis rubeus]|uniref:Glutathione S-transferase family protein n=1 Tax=Halosegnis rubeus TaxID=2212850 RepID=A0A5N5U9S2_9EURY|nr:glutathione S-transferase family protein [Halosegnis rubeus]KAB7515373.1 glutathione S-transferase family protein [Halosegnis rubeus]
MVNMYVDGEWKTDTYEFSDDDGEFDRSPTTFRDELGTEQFPAESGRYHLYISRACPWAHGAAMVRSLMGLEDDISMDIVDPYRDERGWQFTPQKDDCTTDSINGHDYLGETYIAADPEYTGRVTVPVLWDREEETIVNNESIEVMRHVSTAFEGNGTDLYPEHLREEIDEVVDDIYDPINNGVYRAGFAGTQEAYENAVADLFNALDAYDERLADQRYLVGDQLTLADLRLFATLVRFDNVYHTHFKCNVQLIREYDNLWPYVRDIYQTPGIEQTMNMAQIKEHYYTTHTDINPTQFIGVGPDFDFHADHDRARLQSE